MLTQELLTRPDAFEVDPARRVSSRSRLDEDIWDLDTDDPGHPRYGIRIRWWTMPEEHGLPDERERCLLLLFKKLAWLALADSSFGIAFKPAGLFNFAPDACRFVRFAAARGLTGLHEITPAVVDAYCAHVVDEYEAANPDVAGNEVGSVGTVVARRVRVPWAVWMARRRLARAGIAIPASDPLAGASPKDWARNTMTAADARVPAIPPEVFLRIVNAAAEMVTEHASDVLHAQQRWLEIADEVDVKRSRSPQSFDSLREIRFATVGASSLKWPATLTDDSIGCFRDKPSVNLSRLMVSLREACAIVVLATTGVRPSEFIAIPGGWNDAEGLPACIRKERTPDGLMEVYLMRSRLTKGQIVPIDEEWVIGSTPTGSVVVPLAVTALSVLERLTAPWRSRSDDPTARQSIYVRMGAIGLPHRSDGALRPLLSRLGHDLRRFYEHWVAFESLPDRSGDHLCTSLASFKQNRGATIQARQYRKNHSQYLLRSDSGLLPALSRQYKHTSVVTLQYNYTGNSPALMTGVQDEQRLASVRAVAEMLGQGDAARSGRLPEIITRHVAAGQSRSVRVIDAEEADAKGLVLIPGEHGSCGIAWAPHLSRCNQLAGIASFLNAVPSFHHRNPTVCSGCPLFTADRSNLEFWRRRHATYEAIWEEACAAGLENDYRVADARRRSALAHVKKLEGKTT